MADVSSQPAPQRASQPNQSRTPDNTYENSSLKMASEPARHKKTPWAYIRSSFQMVAGGVVLLFSATVVLLFTLFFSPFRLDPFLKVFCKAMVFVAGIDVRIHGLEKLDPKKTYLVIFNHINMFDHFVLYAAMPHKLRGVEKEVHFRWPVYGTLIRRIGQVSIPPRGDTVRAIASLERAQKLMAQGISIAMAPEGTRSKTGELQPFKKGAFHLAVQMQATIAPIVLVGMYQINRKGDWLIYPGPIDVYFEDLIPVTGMTDKDVRALTEKVRNVFVSRLASSSAEAA